MVEFEADLEVVPSLELPRVESPDELALDVIGDVGVGEPLLKRGDDIDEGVGRQRHGLRLGTGLLVLSRAIDGVLPVLVRSLEADSEGVAVDHACLFANDMDHLTRNSRPMRNRMDRRWGFR